ncbi:hypothetical protein SAMN05421539_107122 [Jannaschia seohaensis]|uniref:8-oxoguanine deaminase n=1 Tax=Jannaschia seohaensis TaxID=475081 RepID=A0A2Y9AWF7_9RHOB|nr:hypothetical protein BCF38_107122 [Jannaschia seohaensis]SSA48346.1 hypothetical protein SAMN05421539_107122 [Jannaschia seohaensis]
MRWRFSMAETLIAGGLLWRPEGVRSADLLIRDGAIAEIGPGLATEGARLDAGGCLVTPGLVNTHHHLYQTLTRAVPAGQDALLFG